MDYMKLSKEVSFALRHEPWKYELELDENGWVDIDQLIESLRWDRKWKSLDIKDLEIMIEKSDKKRHEINNGKIRALYGHSTPKKIVKEAKIPPDVLYHGTPKYFIESIREQGLIPKSRQYVHLSSDIETAIQVGKRRSENPILLKINAKQASIDGVKFYHENDTIWLIDYIDSKYIIEE